jgi:hypothetical protein
MTMKGTSLKLSNTIMMYVSFLSGLFVTPLHRLISIVSLYTNIASAFVSNVQQVPTIQISYLSLTFCPNFAFQAFHTCYRK